MHTNEKAIRGGLTAEPFYRYENIAGFTVSWCGQEVASFRLRHAGVVWDDNRPHTPESVEDYILSFWAIVNREHTCQADLAAWWTTFDRFAYDPLWYHPEPV